MLSTAVGSFISQCHMIFTKIASNGNNPSSSFVLLMKTIPEVTL